MTEQITDTTAPEVEAPEVEAPEQAAPVAVAVKPKPNTIGLAKRAVPNGSRLIVTPAGVTETGVHSFRVYRPEVGKDGQVSLRDVTGVLKGVPGADGKFRGRPRTETVLRAQGVQGKRKASRALAEQIAQALYGDEGSITVQEV